MIDPAVGSIQFPGAQGELWMVSVEQAQAESPFGESASASSSRVCYGLKGEAGRVAGFPAPI